MKLTGIAMQPLRKLNHIEASMAYSHQILCGNTQSTSMLAISGDIRGCDVGAYMRDLTSCAEILNCIIVTQKDELFFVIPHQDNIYITEEILALPVDAERLLSHEINRILDAGQGLWRLHVARDLTNRVSYLLLTVHHAITDAWTAREILAYLMKRHRGEEAPSAKQPLTIGVEAYNPERPSLSPPNLPPKRIEFFEYASCETRSSGIFCQNFDEAEAAILKNAARRNAISVNALLAGLFIRSFSEIADSAELSIFSAISQRNRLNLGSQIDDFGCLIKVLAFATLPHDRIVETAAHYQSALAERIALNDGGPADVSHKSIRMNVEALREARTFAGIGMTNLGFIDRILQSAGDLFLDYRTGVNRVGGNLGLTLHVIRFASSISLTFTYPQPLMPDALVRATFATMQQRLHAL